MKAGHPQTMAFFPVENDGKWRAFYEAESGPRENNEK